MLQIWMGRANTGKSAAVLEKIRQLGDQSQQLLLVPEHTSHLAELDLAHACGASASRHAEVLSFRQLANRVLSQVGGLADGTLDAGGKLLMMQLALQASVPSLRIYARPSRKAPFLAELVELCDELQSCQVLPEQLGDVCQRLEGMSADKLRELSIIYAAYLARLHSGGEDRRDLMSKLADNLERSGYSAGKDVFLDGFAYFTAQEEQIISILLRTARSVTITLLGEPGSAQEIFSQSVRAQHRLVRLASACGVECQVRPFLPREPENALQHLEACFFGRRRAWQGACGQVTLYRADTMFTEAEYVASQILSLVRTGNYRFRDITVAVRDLDSYAATIENVFERYGVPVYLSRRSDILEKPVLSLIAGALDAVAGGCEYEDMFRWLKTGLAGITDGECDLLENYVIRWDIHGSMWLRDEDWTGNPDGWQESMTPEQAARLAEINAIRRRVSGPLGRLHQGMKESPGAVGKLRVLWAFLEEIDLAGQLERRTAELEALGQLQQAGEYSQLWELLCQVMDQVADILGEMALDREEFVRLFKLVLTQYDVGTIPAALDQVQITQITRNDRHPVKCLFLMGANDNVLPAVPQNTGLLSREDRSQLLEQGVELAPSGMDLFHIELLNLYAALSQPTERLTVTWPGADLAGETLRPSFVVERIRTLLPGAAELADEGEGSFRLSAPRPALELAGSQRGGALWQYFAAREAFAPQIQAMERAAAMNRGRLSPQAVETLYGKSYRMSASRIDKVNSCHFAYFMQYGLRAKERTPAGFDAAQVGTFLHYLLEHVTRQAMERGGFGAIDSDELRRMIRVVTQQYMGSALPDFDSRDARFRYLFRRLEKTAGTIMENVAQELGESDFVPVAFELGFGGGGQLPAISIQAGDAALTVTGKVDRVDGWLKDGKLYLRVVDYKSGKKAFDLSDLRYGLNIQMLLYLFTLQREGAAYFGREVVPAGVMYLPARDAIINAPRGASEELLRAAMDKELRRSGLVLAQPEVLQAMEHSALDAPRFLPLTLGRGGSITKGIASAAELGKLGKYLDKVLEQIARELRRGNIDADPRGHSENDSACTYCEFASACHFMQADERDHLELIRPMKPEEFWHYVDETIGEEEES